MVPMTLGSINDVTGIIGAITGPAALVLAWISYRRSQQVKALDLRVELRKQASDVRAAVSELPDLLEQSRASRIAVLAASPKHAKLKMFDAQSGDCAGPEEETRRSGP